MLFPGQALVVHFACLHTLKGDRMNRRRVVLALSLLFAGAVIAADTQTKPAAKTGEFVVTYYYMPG